MADTTAATAARMRKKDERIARELIERGWEVRSPEDLSTPWVPTGPMPKQCRCRGTHEN